MASTQITTTIGSNQFLVTLDSTFMSPADCFVIERHNHIAFEFTYMLDGCCQISTKEGTMSLSTNQFCIIGPGVYHDQNASGAVRKVSLSIERVKKTSAEEYFPLEEDLLVSKELSSIQLAIGTDDGTILGLIHDIQTELSAKRFGYYAALQALLAELIISLVRTISKTQKATYDAPQRQLSDTRSLAIENFFEKNYNSKVSISDLSKELFVSSRQTVRILREKYDMSFKQKIIEKRIEVAKTMLCNTQMPVKEIADHIGYETANFSAMFKQKTGLTPKQYRQSNST